MDKLTKREREVLNGIRKGKTNKEIAQELWITEATVETHNHHIYRKLGVSNRTQAALSDESPEESDESPEEDA